LLHSLYNLSVCHAAAIICVRDSVPFLSARAPALVAKKKPPAAPINLDSATSEELQELQELQEVPGIGPATADKILQMRKSYGAFKSVDDLLAVRGIGPKRLEKMRRYLVIGKMSAKQPAAPGAKTAVPPAKTSAAPAPAKKPPVPTPAADDEESEEP
jgi:competence ComEA-like helix-hairpin-helix protein